jgi:hypothetical protein
MSTQTGQPPETNPDSTPSNQFQPTGKVLHDGAHGVVDAWHISFAGNSCELWGFDGLGYIFQLIRTREPLGPSELTGAYLQPGTDDQTDLAQAFGADPEYAQDRDGGTAAEDVNPGFEFRHSRPAMRSVNSATIRKTTEDLNRRAKAADAQGDKATYGSLMLQVAALRRYESTTMRLGGKSKRFPDEWSKLTKAIAESLARAIKEIRKHLPELASHLQSSIKYDGTRWHYVAPEIWDASPSLDGLFSSPTDPEVARIQESWQIAPEWWNGPTPPGPEVLQVRALVERKKAEGGSPNQRFTAVKREARQLLRKAIQKQPGYWQNRDL